MKWVQLLSCILFILPCSAAIGASLDQDFLEPPDSARPGVYGYFMDGNLDQKEMINDLDSMKEAGLGNLIYLEVNVDVPRGPVECFSPQWLDMFGSAVRHAEKSGST